VKNLNKNETGFTLIELLVVVVIVGISAAVATPSLVGSLRQNRANQAFSQLVSALQSAQANANRLSTTCTVTVTQTQVTAAPVGCIQETVNFDSTIINVNTSPTSTTPFTTPIAFNFNGTINTTITPTNPTTLFVARKIGTTLSAVISTANISNANCVVITSPLGFIRTGKYNTSSTNCEIIDKYPN
jgi:prepilin-type N-terminal cleavage/methylation domain-containing protein